MTHRLPTIAMIVLLLLALPAPAEAADYTLEPVQPTVEDGQSLAFRGAGFRPYERVVTWATAPDQAVLGGPSASADDGGRFEVGFTVPSNVLGGRWALTAWGRESQAPVAAYFEVRSRAPNIAAPQAAVAPSSGSPGTLFAFAAFGYDRKEKASYWFTGPDGKVHDAYPGGTQANPDGRVDISWTAPRDALPGTWVMTVQGLQSHVARGVPFEVR